MRNTWQIGMPLAMLAALSAAGICRASQESEATPNFTLAANTATLNLTVGGAAKAISIEATGQNGFKGTVAVKISGLPLGVTATPASLTLKPGVAASVTLTASGSGAAHSAIIVFKGVSGALSHSASIALTLRVDVLTYHYDLGRTGLNPNEAILTHANVISSKFGLLRMLKTDGTVDAQPLLVSNLVIAGKRHNVVYVVTEHDSVYAFDADTGARIWRVSMLRANESPSGDFGCGQISPEIGITSTPVIDRKAGAHGTMFVVSMSQDLAGVYHQRLHALDITTGAQYLAATEITASYPGTGANSTGGKVIFDPSQYAVRAGLLLLNGAIYMGWTSHCDQDPYTGWLMGYSESTLKQTSVLNLTPNGSEGSIWMAGGGLAADPGGHIYFLDANGTFDQTLNKEGFPAKGDFGNGFIKVSTTNGKLAVADYFEMFNTVDESNQDEDLGSGGVMVLPDLKDAAGKTHYLAVGAGKDANIYVVDRAAMGKFNAQNDHAIYQEIDGAIGGVWSKPAYFNSTVYYAATNDTVKAFPIVNAKLTTVASERSVNYFPYPGATPAISANGLTNGIVWALDNSSPAVLHAYDAGTLRQIFNSSQAPKNRDHFGNISRFITPMVANGNVYAETPSGVAVFGLLP